MTRLRPSSLLPTAVMGCAWSRGGIAVPIGCSSFRANKIIAFAPKKLEQGAQGLREA